MKILILIFFFIYVVFHFHLSFHLFIAPIVIIMLPMSSTSSMTPMSLIFFLNPFCRIEFIRTMMLAMTSPTTTMMTIMMPMMAEISASVIKFIRLSWTSMISFIIPKPLKFFHQFLITLLWFLLLWL